MIEYVRPLCLILASLLFLSCSGKRIAPSDEIDDKSRGVDQAKSNAASGDLGSPAEKPSPVTGKYERLQGFTFLVPDQWKTEPAEYGLSLIDNEYPKGGFFLRVMYGQKDDEFEHTPSEEIAELLRKSVEKMVEKDIGVNETKLVESKTLTINGLHTTVFRYSYSSKLQNGDAIQALFNRDSETFWMNGLFPTPGYTQLEPDIKRIIESVRKE